jgi:hypothetical protein
MQHTTPRREITDSPSIAAHPKPIDSPSASRLNAQSTAHDGAHGGLSEVTTAGGTPSEARTFVALRILTALQPDIVSPSFQVQLHPSSTLDPKKHTSNNEPTSAPSKPEHPKVRITSINDTAEQILIHNGFASCLDTKCAPSTSTSPTKERQVLLHEVLQARLIDSERQLRAHRERLADDVRARARPFDQEAQARSERRAQALLNRGAKRSECGTLRSYDSKRRGRSWYRFWCGDILNCPRCNARFIADLRQRFEFSRSRLLDRRSMNRNASHRLHEFVGNLTAPHDEYDPATQTKHVLAAKATLLEALRRYLKKNHPKLEPYCGWFIMLDWEPGHPHFHWWVLLPKKAVVWMIKAWLSALRRHGFNIDSLKDVTINEHFSRFRSPSFEFKALEGWTEKVQRKERRYVVKSPVEWKHFLDPDYLPERNEAVIALTPFARTQLYFASRAFLVPKRR